jgi:4a-hydroxytetrahydrobiopterin dehydratase
MSTLSSEEITARIAGGPWRLDDGALVRDLQVADFAAAMAAANAVAAAAEAADHHPDILVHGWNRLRLTLSTHSAGGVTEADLALAATVDGLLDS